MRWREIRISGQLPRTIMDSIVLGRQRGQVIAMAAGCADSRFPLSRRGLFRLAGAATLSGPALLTSCTAGPRASSAALPQPASTPSFQMRTFLFRSGPTFADVYAKADPDRMLQDVPPKYDVVVYRSSGPAPRVYERRVKAEDQDRLHCPRLVWAC